MKGSRFFIIMVLIIIALISGGAVLGSLLANYTVIYTIITVSAIAVLALSWFFYTGHKKDDDE